MSHASIFTYTLIVSQSVIDENGHVNNVAYVQWMQDAAIRHGAAMNYQPPEHAGWFVREHRVEYLLPAFRGDEIEVQTWLTEWKRVRVHRHYEFTRTADRKVLARGETDWVYVNAQTGRPIAIPEEVKALFPVLANPADDPARPSSF